MPLDIKQGICLFFNHLQEGGKSDNREGRKDTSEFMEMVLIASRDTLSVEKGKLMETPVGVALSLALPAGVGQGPGSRQLDGRGMI